MNNNLYSTIVKAGCGRKGLMVTTILLFCTIKLTAQSTGDYRTRTGATGSWFSTSVWQRYNGSSFVNVTTSPTSADGAIDVRSDAVLNIPDALNVDQLTINGSVTYNASSNGAGHAFTLNNGTGTDLTINGTFIHSGTGNQANFSISSGASWTVAAGGTYVHNSARSVSTPLNAATLDDASTFEYRGSSSLTPAASFSGRTYGNLVFASTSGSFSINGSGSGGITVNGDLTVGSNVTVDLSSLTGTRALNGNVVLSGGYDPYNFTLASGKSLTLNAGGSVLSPGVITYASGSTLIYNSGGTYARSNEWTATSGAGYPSNVQVSGNTLLNLGSGGTGTARQCAGNVTIDAGSTLSMNVSGSVMTAALTVLGGITINGTLVLSGSSGGNINVGGNWVLGAAGTFTPNSRLVSFNGTGTQTISKTGGGSLSFANVTVNKGSGNAVMSNDITVTTNLSLTTGNLSIGSNTLTLGGSFSRTAGSLAGSVTSGLTIGGTAGTLYFDNSGTNNYLKTFTLNSGATATLANALNIAAYDGTSSEGVLTVSGTGVLTAGGFLTIKSNANGTARIAPGNTAGGYISGNVTVERFIQQNSSKAWRLLASNTSGQTINAAWQEGVTGAMNNPNPGFGTKITGKGASLAAVQALGFDTLSARTALYKYNPATDAVAVMPNTNATDIGSEQGYFLYIRGDRSPDASEFTGAPPVTSTVLRSKGTLFLGDQSAISTGASNWGLVRNPFPSRIDMRNIIRTGSLVDAYQVWDAKLGGTYGVGGFQTFSKSGADYIVSPGGGSYGANGSINNFIESGAAFFIQSSGGTGAAQVLESCKSSGSNNFTFRPAGTLAGPQRLAFTLYSINSNNTDVVDGGLVFFDNAYSTGVDIDDVRKSINFNENFGLLRNQVNLAVEKRAPVIAEDTVFFGMSQLKQISYRLDIETDNFEPLLTTAVLVDRYNNTRTVLDLSASNSYTFTVTADAASMAADRFFIALRQSTVVPVTFTSLKAIQADHNIAVEWTVAQQLNISRYEVERSADGRRFATVATQNARNTNGASEIKYNWLDENAAAGNNFYRVKVIGSNGAIQYSNIVKVLIGKGKQGIIVSPNPVTGNYVHVQMTDLAAGSYTIRLLNNTGQIVLNKAIHHAGGNGSQLVQLPAGLENGVYEMQLTAPGSLHVQKLIVGPGN